MSKIVVVEPFFERYALRLLERPMAAIGSFEHPPDAPFLSALSYPALRATLNQEPA